jgi:negative regulator of sigma E activity
MKKILFFILLSISSFVHAQWILISESETGSSKTFMEMKSIQQINQYKRAWVKVEYSSFSSMTTKHSVRSGRYYEEYDCREKKYRELSSQFYKQSDLIDLVTMNNDTQEWKFIVPESVAETKLNFICRR